MRSLALLLAVASLSSSALLAQDAGPSGSIGDHGRALSVLARPGAQQRVAPSKKFLRPGSDAYQWYGGVIQYTAGLWCFTNVPVNETGAFVSYYGDLNNALPKVGQIYWIAVFAQMLGNPCNGGAYATIQLALPQNTYLAVSQTNPVVCYTTDRFGTTTRNTYNCPQSLSFGTYGYRLNPINDPYGAWVLSGPGNGTQGTSVEVQVPVYSTAAINSKATAYVNATGGTPSNAWIYPDVSVGVFANSPSVSYPVPATTSITASTARTNANVANHFVGGNVYFDIGRTTAYGVTSAPIAASASWDSGSYWNDWSSLVAGTTYNWRARFVTSGGATTLGANQTFTTPGTPPTLRGDFDANGKEDIVLRNYATGQNAIWLMNGTTLLSTIDLPALPNTNYRIEGTADFDADGKPDIVLRNYATGQDALWLMNGTALSSVLDLPALSNTSYHFEGTGDFNADGKPDIILRNYATGQNALWLMNGTAVSTIVDLPALTNTNFRIESAADFNGDGQRDIVLRNYATGQNALWLMSGTSLVSIVDLPALPNTSYRIDAVGDYNSDGKADIVLRNYVTGQNAVWLMNGTTLASVVDLPALPNVSYEINGAR